MIHDPLSTVGCWCVVTAPDYDGSECLLSTLIQTSAPSGARVRSRGQSLRWGPRTFGHRTPDINDLQWNIKIINIKNVLSQASQKLITCPDVLMSLNAALYFLSNVHSIPNNALIGHIAPATTAPAHSDGNIHTTKSCLYILFQLRKENIAMKGTLVSDN